MIKKVVIPAAGFGSRLLPMTKELPKEMLPVFVFDNEGQLYLKPMIQMIFEQFYDIGFREFEFIVGRGKRAIEDHFTCDEDFLEILKANKKFEIEARLSNFYSKVNNSSIVFVNQPKPKGFGDAIYRAWSFTKNEPFLMQAGDDIVISKNSKHIMNLIDVFEKYKADAAFLVEPIENPSKYGVILGKEVESNVIKVEKVFEKPKNPPSNLASIAVYAFQPSIYKAIENVKPDNNGEIQLADAIQGLLDSNRNVYALKLQSTERRIDVGTPESYLESIKSFLSSFKDV